MGLRLRRRGTGPNALIASAARVNLTSTRRPKIGSAGWQKEAWRSYDTVGELRFACSWLANAVSRARLFVADVDDAGHVGEAPTERLDGTSELFGGPGPTSALLAALAVHLTVPGDCYVVGESPAADGTPSDTAAGVESWYVVSTEEITARPGRFVIDRGDGRRTLDAEQTVVTRVWRPHPRRHAEADSPTRAVLPVLREIERLSQYLLAQTDSRLAGAGIAVFPTEISFPVTDEDGTSREGSTATDLMQVLAEAMLTSIGDRESAAAVVPIVLQTPGEFVDKIKHLSFDTPLSQQVAELRRAAIGRLAMGMDLPPEIVTGMGDTNHWSAWQLEEQAIKLHVAPILSLICTALTDSYLRPGLDGQPGIDPNRFVIAYDLADLVKRPNRSADAVNLYDRGELSGPALRRETGFDNTDAPTGADARQFLERLALANPDLAPAVLAALGITLPDNNTDTTSPSGPAAAPPRTREPGRTPPLRPSGDVADERPVPNPAPTDVTPQAEAAGQVPAAAPAGVVAACEALALRALELAGKRLRTRANRPAMERIPAHDRHRHVIIDPADLDRLLDGAFTYTPPVARILGVDPDLLASCLDRYVRHILIRATAHSTSLMSCFLDDLLPQPLPDAA